MRTLSFFCFVQSGRVFRLNSKFAFDSFLIWLAGTDTVGKYPVSTSFTY